MRDPALVIPHYATSNDDLQVLEAMLTSLRLHEPEVRTVIVDDCSPEPEIRRNLAAISQRFQAELIRQDENGGFSRTVNAGIRLVMSDGMDVILANADLEFEAPFVQTMSEQEADVVGALLIYPGIRLIAHAGQYFSLLTRTFGHLFQYGPEDLPEAQHAAERPVTHALALIRHEALSNVGLFDEAYCSPGDEPVLTAEHGFVPIAQLDPMQHSLVSVDHSAAGGRIVRTRGQGHGKAGFPFGISRTPFQGDLVVIESARARTRVTPGHRLRVRWTEEALRGHAVYLMRRGHDWRIGVACMSNGSQRAFGPRLRQLAERADALWLVGLFPDRLAAELAEDAWSADYGVPQTLFRAREDKRGRGQAMLDDFWRERHSERGALRLLFARGLDPRYPLLALPGRGYTGGTYHGFLIHAANLVADHMIVGTDPGRGGRQNRQLAAVSREPFRGAVYGLDVVPYHYYVSGGVVVHNSMGHEDVDFNLRVMREGGRCVYQPAVKALHHESIFRGRPSEKLQRWQQESWAHFRSKWATENVGAWVPMI